MTTIYRVTHTREEYEAAKQYQRDHSAEDLSEVVLVQDHFLEQNLRWWPKDGPPEGVLIAEMEPRHALNTYEFLQRRAERYLFKYEVYEAFSPLGLPQGEMAMDAYEAMADERREFPHLWLDEMPLLRALWLRALDGLEV